MLMKVFFFFFVMFGVAELHPCIKSFVLISHCRPTKADFGCSLDWEVLDS